jgi:hypothetical protein
MPHWACTTEDVVKVCEGMRPFDPNMDVNGTDAAIVTNLPAIPPPEHVDPRVALDPQFTPPPDAGVGQ